MAEKFFININEERQGPFTLEELESKGVGPDTYVWCKGMTKWRKARDVADICRYWRCRLADVPVATDENPSGSQPQSQEDEISHGRVYLRNIRSFDPEDPDPNTDLDSPPPHLILPAVIAAVMCMPLVGAVAIWSAVRSRRLWNQAISPDTDSNSRQDLKREAHDAARSAKMWIGITFFLGFIVQAFVMRFLI